ncbi:MAG: hypothetical protein HY791_08520 [Deltaproteobacteria bacterium]|nr:hypothetical protein [Deltaproteobacteria bacterium]
MAALANGLLALGLATSPSPSWANPCERARAATDGLLLELRGDWALRLAPHLSASGVPALADLTRRGDDDSSAFAALSLGLSRQSAALSALRESAPRGGRLARLGWALGLLALGDATATATIANSIDHGSEAERRLAADALGRMRTIRAGILLSPLLRDPDPLTRVLAARRAEWVKPLKSRRALEELADWPEPKIHLAAARALAKRHFYGRALEVLGQPERSRHDARRLGRESAAVAVRAALKSTDALALPAALGVAAAAGVKSALLKRIVGERATGELFAIRWLEGETAALAGIAEADAPTARQIIVALFAYSGAEISRIRLAEGRAKELAPILERWIVTRTVDEDAASWAIRAIAKLDPSAGLSVAKARVLGPEGPAQRTALRTIGRFGTDPLDALAPGERSKHLPTRAVAFRAAVEICRRQ